tara:strand:- start:424 stop:2205 length:1782 start_codon:yes stop_codon:yes gene_type:complete
MKRSFFYLLLFTSFASFLFSYENKWATTRFERWWNSKFSTMQFRQPFTFQPYKIKIGTFYYGSNNFYEEFFKSEQTDLLSSAFTTKKIIDFNDVDNIYNKQGIKLEIDFLGYNFFNKLENKVDFIIGLGYKITKPTSIINMDAWADDNSNKYDYNPIVQELNINSTLAMQWSEKFSPYIYYSYGIIEAELFKNNDGERFIKGNGHSNSLSLGFNIISPLKTKKYNLLYGFEVSLNDLTIDEIRNISSPLLEINSQSVGINFTVGIAYGGKKTDGDKGFNYLINSDYIDAIDKLENFKRLYSKHPKISLANKMIDFSKRQIAYDMLYNGIDCYNENDIDCAISWYNQALENSNDKTLTYEIESRQYIIADDLFADFDIATSDFTINESIEYLEYIESISKKIHDKTRIKKIKFYYEKAAVFIASKNYERAYAIYKDNQKKFENDKYIYQGYINNLVSLLIQKANNKLVSQDYIVAYQTMKLLNDVYPNTVSYIDGNIKILKNELDAVHTNRINKILKEIMSNVRKEFFPLDESTVIMIGNTYDKIISLLGEPNEIADRIRGNDLYLMSLHTVNNKTYRFYFENNILFDFEEVIK